MNTNTIYNADNFPMQIKIYTAAQMLFEAKSSTWVFDVNQK